MRISFAIAILALGYAPLAAQAPAGSAATAPAATPGAPTPPAPTASAAPAPAAQVARDDIGFSYSLPSDWESVALPTAPKPVVPYPTLAAPTKGDACVEVALTAKRGDPASVVVVIVLPFACYGQSMTVSDLPNFGEGAKEGMKQTFDLIGPVEATYSLGSHSVWIERAKGNAKSHPESQYTFEIACTVLKKGAACWMTMAADQASLQAFEDGTVSLDGEAAVALVPASAFLPNKP